MREVYFRRTRLIPSGLFKILKRVGFQAVDMHFHTEHSMDAVSPIHKMLKKCQKRGIGVAITDHNNMSGVVKAWNYNRRVEEKKKVFVIPGMEASTKDGAHALYYFYSISSAKQFFNHVIAPLRKKNPFFLPVTIENLMDKAKKYNAVISVAHPYGVGKIGIKKIKIKGGVSRTLKKFHLTEGLNSSQLRRMNEKAISWAQRIGKGMTAGSDGHFTKELGAGLTLAHGTDQEEFLTSLKKNRGILLGREVNIFVTAISQIVKEKNYFQKAYEQGLGWLWITDHAKELKKLQRKIKEGGADIQYQHPVLKKFGLDKKSHKHYTTLRFGKM
jgi:predicted metal-dependent phosphoesterase TrpH